MNKKYEYNVQVFDNILSYMIWVHCDNIGFCWVLFKGIGDHY